MSGPEMLLIAGLKAFVPKNTAEKINATLEGMLRDGTLQGIGSLVSDIAEIKARLISIDAILRSQGAGVIAGRCAEAVYERGEDNGLSRDTAAQPRQLAPPQHRTDGGPGGGIGTSGQSDNGHGNGAGTLEDIGGR